MRESSCWGSWGSWGSSCTKGTCSPPVSLCGEKQGGIQEEEGGKEKSKEWGWGGYFPKGTKDCFIQTERDRYAPIEI